MKYLRELVNLEEFRIMIIWDYIKLFEICKSAYSVLKFSFIYKIVKLYKTTIKNYKYFLS